MSTTVNGVLDLIVLWNIKGQHRIGNPEWGSDSEDNDCKGYAMHDRCVGWLGCMDESEEQQIVA